MKRENNDLEKRHEKASDASKRGASLFTCPIVALTRICVRFPAPTLVAALLLAAVALVLTCCELRLKTSRLDLIDPKSDFNQYWLDYVADFGDEDDLVVAVEGRSASEIAPVLDAVAEELRRRPRFFKATFAGIDPAPLARKGLYFFSDEQRRDAANFANLAQFLVAGRWEVLAAESTATGLARRLDAERTPAELSSTLDELWAFSRSLAVATSPETTNSDAIPSPFPTSQDENGVVGDRANELTEFRRLINDAGTFGVVNFELVEGKEGAFAYGTAAIDEARTIVADVRARFPSVDVGLTGLTVMENDEMRASQATSTISSVLALIGVTLVFIATFGGLKRPLIAVFALAIGFAWTMGFVVLAVGHLNILSMSFGVVLIGLGIDFGIHYISKYTTIRAENRSVGESILATAESVGPNVFSGAATTAAAFAAIGFSEFTGIAELGIVSAGGILLCCLATLVVVPATLQLVDGARPFRAVERPIDICSFVVPIFRFPKTVLFATLLPTVALGFGVVNLRYDSNLLNMQPEKLESVEYERKLFEKWDKGAWFAISLADSAEELLERKARFEADPTLRTDEIVSIFPRVSPEKQRQIAQISDALRSFQPFSPASIVVPVGNEATLRGALDGVAASLNRCEISTGDVENTVKRRDIQQNLDAIYRQIAVFSADEYATRIDAFQRRSAFETLERLLALQAVSSPIPPDLNDFPPELVKRYVGAKTGRLALRVYSTQDVWDPENLGPFVEKIRAVDPAATGNPIQTFEASLQMERSYFVSGIWALCVVFVLVSLDFRSIYFAILALTPTFLGCVQAFGLLGWLGVPLNAANAIVVPLILGIGVDDGIHLARDFRISRGEFKLATATASSIVLTTLTTAIGFGSLMIADHRGLQSLGRVLTIGVVACMTSALIIMPAILTVIRRRELAKELPRR